MKNTLCVFTLVVLSLNAQAADTKSTTNQTGVKKSASGICHESSSRFYAKLKHFTSYDSLKACLDSGGHQPAKTSKK